MGSQQEPFWRDLLPSSCFKQYSDTYTAPLRMHSCKHQRTASTPPPPLWSCYEFIFHAAVNFPDERERRVAGRQLGLLFRFTAASFNSERAGRRQFQRPLPAASSQNRVPPNWTRNQQLSSTPACVSFCPTILLFNGAEQH